MKVGIDIRPLEGSQYGGVTEYIRNLLPKMFEIASEEDEFHIFCNSYKHKAELDLSGFSNVIVHEFHYPNKVFSFFCRYLNFPKLDKIMGGLDVFFSPHFFPAPISSSCAKVTTFHDLSFEMFPDFFDRKRRLWHKIVKPKKQAISSDAIIAVSSSTKRDIEDIYGIPAEAINVVYSGVDHLKESQKKWSNIRKKYNIPKKYILSLNTIEPRKNMVAVIRAFNEIAQEKRFSDTDLVIAGNLGWSYQEFQKEVKISPHNDRIFITGPIDEGDKASIYKNSSAFIYPSLYEGFGLPPLEAMAQGIPSVVSFSTSLPEVTGGAAILVDPTRPIEIAETVKEILSDERLFDELSAKGKEQADKFTWEKTAKDTLNVLRKTAEKT